jgi:hypothetical protein
MKTKVIIGTLVVGVVAFLANPSGPLGGFWAPPAGGRSQAALRSRCSSS